MKTKAKNELRVIVKAVKQLENKSGLTFGAFLSVCNGLRESEGLAPVNTLSGGTLRNWVNRVAKTLGNNEESLVLKSSQQSKDFNIQNKTTLRVKFDRPIDRSKTQISPQVKDNTFSIKGNAFLRKKAFEIDPDIAEAIKAKYA